MGLVQTSAPAVEPFTVADAKVWLRCDRTDEDTLIESLISAARQGAEDYLNRALITQTWALYLDRFPSDRAPIRIPNPPLQSVSSITYVDVDGATQTWASSNYQVDNKSTVGEVVLKASTSYPATQTGMINAVVVTFVCGYGAASTAIPPSIIQGMRYTIADIYGGPRENLVTGEVVAQIANGTEHWLWPHRVIEFTAQRTYLCERF